MYQKGKSSSPGGGGSGASGKSSNSSSSSTGGGWRVLQLQDGQASAQGGGRQNRSGLLVDPVIHQTQDEQPAEVFRLAQGRRRGGPEAVLTQVQLEQGV
jgi:hypothetical protein